jgi:ABC-type antimicrobial peptide transport system permease subunit
VVFTYNLLSAFVGSVLGVCVGVGGVQAASTVLRWFSQSVNVHPFLEWSQFGQVLLLSLIFSALGCLYPAIKCVHKRVVG